MASRVSGGSAGEQRSCRRGGAGFEAAFGKFLHASAWLQDLPPHVSGSWSRNLKASTTGICF